MKCAYVVFDFFGVICSEVAPFWLARHFGQEKAAALKVDVVGAADRGEIDERNLFEQLGRLSGGAPEQVEADWYALATIDPRMVQLVRDMRRSCRIGLLTNAPSSFIRTLLVQHHIDGLFDAVTISSELGVAKPEPRAYMEVLSRLGASAAQTVFIDDNPANVVVAEQIGMHGYLFSSYEALLSYLPGYSITPR